ncbi:MAG: alpha-2-macroglobulin family protein [bacterium]|nr:alpha-2-macroglobulin family protein [bacterium]
MASQIQEFLRQQKKTILLAVLVIGTIIFYFYLAPKKLPQTYQESYRLVPEKVSQSAAIPVFLPPNVDRSSAQKNIRFQPEIEGKWLGQESKRANVLASLLSAVSPENENIVYFKPKSELNLNRHYEVELALAGGEGKIRQDFLAVENPEIIGVFPSQGSETPENSEITIVFNRPMVPLTTLGYLEEKNVPVEISPQTPGRFKWITTRNLQFIPQERLLRASNYQVRIKAGFVSLDGLEVKPVTNDFITRRLRYVDISREQILYDQAVAIRFNQPVNLDKTRGEISLIDNATGRPISFIAEYQNENGAGQKAVLKTLKDWGNFLLRPFARTKPSSAKDQKEENLSTILVYNQKDRFGRERFWNFNQSYSLRINRAYPLEGDIALEEGGQTDVSIPNIVQSVSASSERTSYADPGFFDPQGKLVVSFYEEVNLDQSRINVPKLENIVYGEKCRDEEEAIYSEYDCEKIINRKALIISFKADQIGLGETFEIVFERIVNSRGLTINREPIRQNVVAYPQLKILSTSPANNAEEASVKELVICSNSPLLAPETKDLKEYLKADLDYTLNYWWPSYRVNYFYSGEKCGLNEFHTNIGYGLMPRSHYQLQLKAEDLFGQKTEPSLNFTTGPIPPEDLNFYHFQKTYNVTSPTKTKLAYAAQNMAYVQMDICKLDSLGFLYYLGQKPNLFDPPQTMGGCQERTTKTIELPHKFWGKNYFRVDIKDYFENPLGYYVLTFSHPDYKTTHWSESGYQSQRPVFERTYLNVTNLAVAEKKIRPETAFYGSAQPLTEESLAELRNLYWITDLSSLAPINQAKVRLFQGKNLNSVGTFFSNEEGVALTKVVDNLQGAIVSHGEDSTVIPPWENQLDWVSSAATAKKIYLYTDKPIYRPAQEVFIKGVFRLGYDGNYEIYRDKNINLKAYNSRSEEMLNQSLAVNEFGTFNAKLLLDKNAPLGEYRICADDSNCTFVDVQEYQPSPFEVKLSSDKGEYVSKDVVNLTVDANYYFGVPLEGGEISYSFSSQNYYFDRYSDEYLRFGPERDYWQPYYYGDRFLFRGKAELVRGQARISQPLDIAKVSSANESPQSKIVVVDVTITNPQGQSVSAQKSFILHAGEFYLGINSDKYFVGKNEEVNLKIKSLDLQGQPQKVSNVNLRLYKVNWVYAKRQEATGGYSYKWEKRREEVNQYSFATNSQGEYIQPLKMPREGEYEAEVFARDSKENLVTSTYGLYVWGEGQVSVRPTEGTNLEVKPEKTDLEVGQQGSLIIKSPFKNAKALISIERGRIFDYQIKEIEGSLYKFNFEIKEEYVPNVFVSVLLQSSSPEIKFGKAEFKINTKTKELEISVKPNKTSFLPGEEVILDIEAKDAQGKGVSSELSVAVVDLSVLALKGNPQKNPLVFFYGGFPLTVSASSNLKNILVETEISKTKGGSGRSDEALSKRARGVFRETALWEGSLKTGEDGRAQIRFALPDNLTTWQAETLGVTKDTKLGINYQEFMTKKELMIVPLKPRFIVPGDQFFVGAKIFNQSSENQKLEVSFESPTLLLKGDNAKKQIRIDKNETQTVYFEAQAPEQMESGEHRFVLSAKNGDLEDTVIQYIKITPNNTYETTSTASYATDKVIKEYVFLPENVVKEKGDLRVNSSATLAVFLSDALNYLIQYPYAGSEQIAARLKAIAIVKKGLNLPNLGDKFQLEKVKYDGREYSIDELVEIGLAQLYNNQRDDGGFAFWRGGGSSFYATLSAVEALQNLSLAGFRINQNSLERAANYLNQEITSQDYLYRDENNVILAASALSQLPDWPSRTVLKQKVTEIARNDLFIKERSSNTSLAYLAILMSERSGDFPVALKQKIFETLNNRVDIDSRGAFLEPNQNRLWYYYETPIKDTALYLKALSKDQSENPFLDKVVRWILNSREKDGAWGSTNNTLQVVDAFTDYLNWKKETESDFSLSLQVNDNPADNFRFEPRTILDQFKKLIPLKELKFNENNLVKFIKEDLNSSNNGFYYDLVLKYYLPADQIAPRDEGFSITRSFYRLDDAKNEKPVVEAKTGDVLRVNLQITVPKSRHFVAVEDYIPAGLEIVNLDLATEQKSLRLQEKELTNSEFQPSFKELRDDQAFLFTENLEPGVYEFDYYVRAMAKGNFIHLPARAYEMYFPENFGRTAGSYFVVR